MIQYIVREHGNSGQWGVWKVKGDDEKLVLCWSTHRCAIIDAERRNDEVRRMVASQ